MSFARHRELTFMRSLVFDLALHSCFREIAYPNLRVILGWHMKSVTLSFGQSKVAIRGIHALDGFDDPSLSCLALVLLFALLLLGQLSSTGLDGSIVLSFNIMIICIGFSCRLELFRLAIYLVRLPRSAEDPLVCLGQYFERVSVDNSKQSCKVRLVLEHDEQQQVCLHRCCRER